MEREELMTIIVNSDGEKKELREEIKEIERKLEA
jgi:hypothetical protein